MWAVRALVVESDAKGMANLALGFAAMQIHADCLQAPAAALSCMQDSRYSLAIVSYELQGGGFPFVAQLLGLARERGQHLDVFVVASQDGASLRAAAAKLDVRAVLQRPVSLRALAQAVEGILCLQAPQSAGR